MTTSNASRGTACGLRFGRDVQCDTARNVRPATQISAMAICWPTLFDALLDDAASFADCAVAAACASGFAGLRSMTRPLAVMSSLLLVMAAA